MLTRRLFMAGLSATPLSITQANAHSSHGGFNPSGIAWHSYRSGLRAARRSRRPIFLVMHATWCHACVEYQRLFFDPRVEKLTKKFVCVLVDIDREPRITDKYIPDDGYVPHTTILEPNGAVRRNAMVSKGDDAHYIDTDNPRQLIRVLKKNG